jgi:hypothetical protein
MRTIVALASAAAVISAGQAAASDHEDVADEIVCPPFSTITVSGPEGWLVTQPNRLRMISTAGGSAPNGPLGFICRYAESAETAFEVRLQKRCPAGSRAVVQGDPAEGVGRCVMSIEVK